MEKFTIETTNLGDKNEKPESGDIFPFKKSSSVAIVQPQHNLTWENQDPHPQNPVSRSIKCFDFLNSSISSNTYSMQSITSNWKDFDVQDLLSRNMKVRPFKKEKAFNKKSDDLPLVNNYVKKIVDIIGVAVKEGQNLCGVELSPGLFRQCGLLNGLKGQGWKVRDVGDITTESLEEPLNELLAMAEEKKWKYNLENGDILGVMNKELSDCCYEISKRKEFSLILGGDHGLATGSISGMLRTYPDLKVIWIDAHGDCNIPETSPSQNYHGMPVAHLMGWIGEGKMRGFDWLVPALKPENIAYIGLRDIDDGEKIQLKKYNIKAYSPYDIELKGGIANVVEETFDYLKCGPGQKSPIHCSWDVDGCDPFFMPGTGTKARCGLTLRESHFILQRLWDTQNLVSLDMVEVNTLLDENTDRESLHGDMHDLRGKQTLLYAAEMILTGLGFKFL